MSQLVRKIISTSSCPRPVGPYNQAIIVDRTLYLSGMIGIDPTTSQLVTGDFQAELRQTLNNIVKLLEKAGSKVDNVIKCTILLSDIGANYAMVNEEYSKGTMRCEQDIYANNIFSFPLLHPFCLSSAVFREYHPVRTCYQAGKLPLGAAVEIEVIALVGDVRVETVVQQDGAKL